jgi:hypothetical protein
MQKRRFTTNTSVESIETARSRLLLEGAQVPESHFGECFVGHKLRPTILKLVLAQLKHEATRNREPDHGAKSIGLTIDQGSYAVYTQGKASVK